MDGAEEEASLVCELRDPRLEHAGQSERDARGEPGVAGNDWPESEVSCKDTHMLASRLCLVEREFVDLGRAVDVRNVAVPPTLTCTRRRDKVKDSSQWRARR